jgi:hypothetical protein
LVTSFCASKTLVSVSCCRREIFSEEEEEDCMCFFPCAS